MSASGTKRTIAALQKFVRFWTRADKGGLWPGGGLSAYDAVDGAYAAASRWRRMVGSKGEIQQADADVGSMKNASAQIGQTNW